MKIYRENMKMNRYLLIIATLFTFSYGDAFASACQTFVDSKTYDDASKCLDEMTAQATEKYGNTRDIPAGKMLAALKALGVAVRNKNNYKLQSGNAIIRTREYLEEAAAAPAEALPAVEAAPAPTAAGGAENPQYGKFTQIVGLLNNKLANYAGADKAELQDKLGLLSRGVNRACADQSSDACAAALKNSSAGLTALTNKVRASTGGAAPATAPAPVAASKQTVKRLGPVIGRNRNK